MTLRIVEDIVQTVGHVHGVCRSIAKHDPDLSRQIRRAINSVGLNAGEGLHARGGNRTVRLESAMNSGREVVFGLRIADAAGYLDTEQSLGTSTRSIGSSPLSTSSPTRESDISAGRRILAGGPAWR